MMSRKAWLLGSATAALLFAGPQAYAQSSAASMAAAAAAAAPAGNVVEEIVVTAEKRTQSLQKVPEAVSAYTANVREKIGIITTADLASFTPGLQYNTGGDRATIRGIGRQNYNIAIENGVATYADGVYVQGASATAADPLFIQRTEVLRGPQGTLYGRNSIGGAINVISARPTKDFEAEVRVAVENYEKEKLSATVSGPISDSLRFRLSGYYDDQNIGYYKNVAGGWTEGNWGSDHMFQAQLEGNIGSSFDFWVKAQVNGSDHRDRFGVTVGPYDVSTIGAGGVVSGYLAPTGSYALGQYLAGNYLGNTLGNTPTVANLVQVGGYTGLTNPSTTSNRLMADAIPNHAYYSDRPTLAAQATWHLPGVDVKWIGGYSAYEYHDVVDAVGNPVVSYTFLPNGTLTGANNYLAESVRHAIEDKSYFSNELNFTSTNNGPVQWIVGLYQYREQFHEGFWYPNPNSALNATPMCRLIGYFTCASTPAAPVVANDIYDVEEKFINTSYAGFAQADWKLNDLLKFTGGIRYTADNKTGYEYTRQLCYGLTPYFNCGFLTSNTNPSAVDVTQLLIRGATDPATGLAYKGVTYAPTYDPANGYWYSGLGASWSALTGTAGVEFTPDKQSLYYFKYSRGYKAGGFNANTLLQYPYTGPETVDAYEIGFKKDFGRTFRMNGSLFYYNYDGMQTPLTFYPVAGPTVSETINLAHVQTDGVELEATWQPIENLQILANYAYLSAVIHAPCDKGANKNNCFIDGTDPTAAYPGANQDGPCSPAVTSTNLVCSNPPTSDPRNTRTQFQSLNGATLPNSPANKFSLNANYTFRLEPGDFNVSASYIWQDKQYSSVFNRAYNLAPAYSRVDLRATWTDKSDRYTVIAYMRNALDTVGYESRTGVLLASAARVPGTTGAGLDEALGLTPPRTFGIEMQYRFK